MRRRPASPCRPSLLARSKASRRRRTIRRRCSDAQTVLGFSRVAEHAGHVHAPPGTDFNFDSLQLNQAVTTNFTRKSASKSVKSGLTSMFGPALLNEIRGRVATDPRDEIPNSRLAGIVIYRILERSAAIRAAPEPSTARATR